MALGEATGKKPLGADEVLACMTRRQFCHRNHLSESFYFKLKRLGLGPVEMRVLNKTLITYRAETAWQAARETHSQSEIEAA